MHEAVGYDGGGMTNTDTDCLLRLFQDEEVGMIRADQELQVKFNRDLSG